MHLADARGALYRLARRPPAPCTQYVQGAYANSHVKRATPLTRRAARLKRKYYNVSPAGVLNLCTATLLLHNHKFLTTILSKRVAVATGGVNVGRRQLAKTPSFLQGWRETPTNSSHPAPNVTQGVRELLKRETPLPTAWLANHEHRLCKRRPTRQDYHSSSHDTDVNG